MAQPWESREALTANSLHGALDSPASPEGKECPYFQYFNIYLFKGMAQVNTEAGAFRSGVRGAGLQAGDPGEPVMNRTPGSCLQTKAHQTESCTTFCLLGEHGA